MSIEEFNDRHNYYMMPDQGDEEGILEFSYKIVDYSGRTILYLVLLGKKIPPNDIITFYK